MVQVLGGIIGLGFLLVGGLLFLQGFGVHDNVLFDFNPFSVAGLVFLVFGIYIIIRILFGLKKN